MESCAYKSQFTYTECPWILRDWKYLVDFGLFSLVDLSLGIDFCNRLEGYSIGYIIPLPRHKVDRDLVLFTMPPDAAKND